MWAGPSQESACPPPGAQPPPGNYPGSPPRHDHPGHQLGEGFEGAFGTERQEPDIADWWQRLVARLIDGVGFLIVRSALYPICWGLFGPSYGFDGTGFHVTGSWLLPVILSTVFSGLLYAAYDVVMHVKFGATGGKLLLKLKLVGQDRQPASQAMIIKRALVYPGVLALTGVVAGLTYSTLALGGTLLALATIADGIFVLVDQTRRQALHDRVAGTVVLKTTANPPPAEV